MEGYSSFSSSASSSLLQYQNRQGTKPEQKSVPYYSQLHSIHKPTAKPWKKPVAPLPPTLPRVYKVDPINFRDVVQKLTGAPEFQDYRLQTMAIPQPTVSISPSSPAAPALNAARSAFAGESSLSYNGHSGVEFSQRH